MNKNLVWFTEKPSRIDAFILSAVVIFITWHPLYLHGKMNLFELGLYLPGIDGILHGQIPYRDFFYLRGPFEIYVPAVMMRLFGENVAVLETCFYVGTVVSMIICVLLAVEMFQTRLFLCLFVPVFIARTFPRVVFTYWGGMRYALGILALLLMVKFFKQRRQLLLYLSGVVSALALMTSVEIGVCLFPAVGATLLLALFYEKKNAWFWIKSLGVYIAGVLTVLLIFVFYMLTTNSLGPFIEAVYAVVFKSHPTFVTYLTSTAPKTAGQFIYSMLPGTHNFKYLTPMYLYVVTSVYIGIRFLRKNLSWFDLAVTVVAGYGFFLYLAAFRIIEGGQFETALQPEKILLFLGLEILYFYIKDKFSGVALKFFIAAVVISTMVFSLGKYAHRFFIFKYVSHGFNLHKKGIDPLYGFEYKTITFDRGKGMVVPADQGVELEQVVSYIQTHSLPTDKVFVYPDKGAYSFFMERPYVGRFPIACLSWMNDNWPKELMQSLKEQEPAYAVLAKDPGIEYREVYFTRKKNRKYYDDVIQYIQDNYDQVLETPESYIFKLKRTLKRVM
jgi:hypothetical protein